MIDHFSGCMEFLASVSHRPRDSDVEREEFERCVKFLGSVPLFKRMPPDELPLVARNLTSQTWRPGEKLVKEGDMGRAFFLIQSGTALVMTGEEMRERTELQSGDYFGGHCLVSERPNVATIVAGPDGKLVTLSMSRKAFERLGFKERLHFPKRKAIHETATLSQGKCRHATTLPHLGSKGPTPTLSNEELDFVRRALRKNPNLRALVDTSDAEVVDTLAQSAVLRDVPEGTEVASFGELAREFFVVRAGLFDVVVPRNADGAQRSAEELVAHSSMAERMLRKQDFLGGLFSRTKQGDRPGRAMSVKVGRRASKFVPSKSTTTSSSSLDTITSSMSASPVVFGVKSPRAGSKLAGFLDRFRISKTTLPEKDICMEVQEFRTTARNLSFYDQDAKRRRRTSRGNSTVSDGAPICVFGVGDSFGELSLLYNTRREATFLAQVGQPAAVYAIPKQAFQALTNKRRQPRFKEYSRLLDEVSALTPLLQQERWELACNAIGFVTFRPHERILHQGKVRFARQWYVVSSGTGVVSQEVNLWEADKPTKTPSTATSGSVEEVEFSTLDDDDVDGPPSPSTYIEQAWKKYCEVKVVQLGELTRGSHFGERSLLRGEFWSEVNIDAGPEGMTCLTFNFEVIKPVLENAFKLTADPLYCSAAEWLEKKTHDFAATEESIEYLETRRSIQQLAKTSLHELKEICILGRGAFGAVSLVESTRTRKRFALKRMSKGHIERAGAGKQVRWERELLLMIDSPFIVQCYTTYKDHEHVYFLLEAALGGSLFDFMTEKSEVFRNDAAVGSVAAFYIACLVAALEHLHERNIAYRDLKLENAMLDEKGYAKLCDMGFARFVLSKTHTLVGTPDYMAPEMIDVPHEHDMGVDWWGLGVLAYELLCGQLPFDDEGISDPHARLLSIRRSQERTEKYGLRFAHMVPAAARSFVRCLLQKQRTRLGCEARCQNGAEAVRKHPMFQKLGFDFEALHKQTLPAPFLRPWREADRSDVASESSPKSAKSMDSLFSPLLCREEDLVWARDFG